MDCFEYRAGSLRCESVELSAIAEAHGTPLYVYSKRTLCDHYTRFAEAFAPLDARIRFSVKCCHNLSILRLLHYCGAGFDVVSGGELARVLEIGADPKEVVFAGVGKSDAEMRAALDHGIGWFNVESEQELDRLDAIAADAGRSALAAMRINPDVDPHTHAYTTTGKRETKFGVDIDRAEGVFASRRPGLPIGLCGLHVHIGSPVNTIDPYLRAIERAVDLIDRLRRKGHVVRALNIGGGFGAHYDGGEAPSAAAYAERIIPLLSGAGLEVLIEPGRCIAANAGVLLTRVVYTKSSGVRRFIIVDAALTELLRPALYGAFHFAWPVRPAEGIVPPSRRASLNMAGAELVDIVGPVCESGDFLARERHLPPLRRGDLIAVFSTGAYGSVMSSQYNSRPRAAEVLVDGDATCLIRRRESYDDLVAPERV